MNTDTLPVATGPLDTNNIVTLGTSNHHKNCYNGYIKDFAQWEWSRSWEEVDSLYHGKMIYDKLIGYYPMNVNTVVKNR